MKLCVYPSGDEVKPGDRILYHGESGQVDFVVTEKTGDSSRDWYLEQFPGGGFMITATGFGAVFLQADELDEDLTFVSRD